MPKFGSGKSGLFTRVASALVIGPAALLIVYLGGIYFKMLMLAGVTVAALEWIGMANKAPSKRLSILINGMTYLAVSCFSFLYLRLNIPHGDWLLIAVIVTVAASDTAAYFSGKKFGKKKLAPVISPNKTWIGFYGALIGAGCMLLLVVVLADLKDIQLIQLPSIAVFGLGVFMGLVGQIGDLVVSSLKRHVGVKDTGKLIPGHGGILDRVDSLVLVVPFFTGVLLCL